MAFCAEDRGGPKAATGRARGKLHNAICSSRLWDFNCFDISRARATPLARPVIGGKLQQTMNYAVGLIPDKKSNYP